MNPQDIKNSIAQKMSKAGNKIKATASKFNVPGFLKPNIARASGATSPVPRTPNFSFAGEKPAIANNRLYQGKYPYTVAGGNNSAEFAPPGHSSRVYSFNATTTAGQPYQGDYYSGWERPFVRPTFSAPNGQPVIGQYNPGANLDEMNKVLAELKSTPIYDVVRAENGGKNW